jgi:hypothetical protein
MMLWNLETRRQSMIIDLLCVIKNLIGRRRIKMEELS